MARRPNSSRQTEALLIALIGSAPRWRYGYDLSRETGLKSGTLYPILMRLELQGWLNARWEDEPVPGKPRRHLYRLTSQGAAAARRVAEESAQERAPMTRVLAQEGGAE